MNNYGKGLIQSAVEDVDNKFIKNKYELSRELNDALKNKYKKVEKNEEKYIELLKFNIIYYKTIIKKLETIVDVWIQNGAIASPESVEKKISEITDNSKSYVNRAMKEGIDRLNEKDKKIFLSYDSSSGLERLEKVENDYKILNIYKDILGMLINVIASDVEKYKSILDMSVNEAKVDIMNEIFKLVNEILFSEDPETSNFEDEALVGDNEMESSDLKDADKCLSFKKYASKISTPEISVKINDIFTNSTELEDVDEEEAYVFSTDMKDYVSCIVLLLDYISNDDKKYFENVFRMFVIGEISEAQFKELCERYIRENLFLDSKTWLECQKNVKSDFNMENNKFFGENTLKDDPEDEDLSITQKMDILKNLDDGKTVKGSLDAIKEKFQDEEEKIGGFAEKLKKGISSFSDKLKMNEEYEDDDSEYDDYDDEYEEEYDDEYYDDEYEEFDEELIDDFEKKPSKFASKLKSIFKKHDDSEDDYDSEEDDDEDIEEEIEIDPELFKGDESIQDKEALAILKMREKSRIKEDEHIRKEYDKLRKERELAEEINKNGGAGFIEDEDIVFDEEDYVYKKNQEKKEKIHTEVNKDLFDNTIDGKNYSFTIEEDNDGVREYRSEKNNEADDRSRDADDSEEDFDFKPILGKTQRLQADKIKRATDKTTVIELGHLNRKNKAEENKEASREESANETYKNKDNDSKLVEFVSQKDDSKEDNKAKDSIEEVTDLELVDDGTKDLVKADLYDSPEEEHIFEELEAMKAMKTDGISVTPTDKTKKSKVDLSSLGKKAKKEEKNDGDEHDFEDDENKPSIKERFKKFSEGVIPRSDDETTVFSKTKVVRDTIIIVAIVVIIFFAYVFIIKGFKVPSVEQTNKNVKVVQGNSRESGKNSNNNNAINEDPSKVSKKTEADREKDEAESKASALDREADQYKGQKGVYYTVFVGATKDKDGAESVAYNFAQRGVKAKVIRNGGYYMLKVGQYFDYNQAYAESRKISAKGIQNYIAARNKYYDLKIEALQIRMPYLSNEQLKTDYDDLKNQIASTGKNSQYITNLDEIYKDAMKDRQ